MTKKAKTATAPKSGTLEVESDGKESREELGARIATWAIAPAACIITSYAKPTWGELSMTHVVDQLKTKTKAAQGGDLKDAEAMLAAQAVALNTMFGELARRAQVNMGECIGAADTYMRLALRAQNQCRSTLETLATIKNPPVVFAKQANIAHGHQQVNNGTVTRTEQIENQQTGLLERNHGQRLDTGKTAATSRSNPPLETVAAVDRTTKRRRKSKSKP